MPVSDGVSKNMVSAPHSLGHAPLRYKIKDTNSGFPGSCKCMSNIDEGSGYAPESLGNAWLTTGLKAQRATSHALVHLDALLSEQRCHSINIYPAYRSALTTSVAQDSRVGNLFLDEAMCASKCLFHLLTSNI